MHPSRAGLQSPGSFGAALASFFRYFLTRWRYLLPCVGFMGHKALFHRPNVLIARLLTYL